MSEGVREDESGNNDDEQGVRDKRWNWRKLCLERLTKVIPYTSCRIPKRAIC